MSNFRQVSKSVRFGMMIALTETMSQDTAVRFSYIETLNRRMLDKLEDINSVRPGVKDDLDQLKALNALFGDGNAVAPSHLVAATELLIGIPEEEHKKLKFSVITEKRDSWWLPPRIVSVGIFDGKVTHNFVDAAYAAN